MLSWLYAMPYFTNLFYNLSFIWFFRLDRFCLLRLSFSLNRRLRLCLRRSLGRKSCFSFLRSILLLTSIMLLSNLRLMMLNRNKVILLDNLSSLGLVSKRHNFRLFTTHRSCTKGFDYNNRQ